MRKTNADDKSAMNGNEQEPLEVPYGDLSDEALRGVAEAFVLREGTDYGQTAYTLQQKVAHVISQLERGEAAILFDPNSAGIEIVMKRDLGCGPL